MSYIDDNLLPDEQILFRTKKHIIIFLIPIVLSLVTVFFYWNINLLFPKVIYIPLAATVLAWLNSYLNYLVSDFAVTNKRLFLREGLLIRHISETRLDTIANTNVNQSLLGQLLDFGSLVVSTMGQDKDIFSEVGMPMVFQRHIQLALDKVKQR